MFGLMPLQHMLLLKNQRLAPSKYDPYKFKFFGSFYLIVIIKLTFRSHLFQNIIQFFTFLS